jgi:hypothetical protein
MHLQSLSRRNMLRLAGGAAGATGILGAGLLTPTYASSKVRIWLNREVVESGERLTLHINESLKQNRRIRVKDSTGLTWKKIHKSRRSQVWVATAAAPGPATVRVVTTRADGRIFRDKVHYQVTAPVTATPSGTGATLIGMSAPASVWGERVSQVGPGLAARRIFADLADGPTSQIRLVEEAHAAGMLPVISYKVGGDVAGAVSGAYNGVAQQAAAKLASYGRPTAVSFWHEPSGDLTGAQHAAASRQILPMFKRDQLRVGPILNGWLLDNQVDEFASFCPDDLFSLWQWVGIDTYESGTVQSPGPRRPAERIKALSAYVQSRGYGHLPLGVGEYNGFSAESIAESGEALLSTPNVWFGCLWNTTGDRAIPLDGDRLTAFQQTLADPRAGDPI